MRMTNAGFSDDAGSQGADILQHFGPTLQAQIGFDPSYRLGAVSIPSLPERLHSALVDTGAADSCIDSALAMSLNLPIIDQQERTGASGRFWVNLHAAQIYIPSLNWVISGMFAGVHLSAGGQTHMALIGRTFLRNFAMLYEGQTGQVTISRDA